jgi:primosomal replication protein N
MTKEKLTMKKQIKTIGLGIIQTSVTRSDIETARQSLTFAIGASVDVSGVVLKRVKRSGECKLLINPDNATMQIIADCKGDEQTVISRKIRKKSKVSITGKLLSFGASSVCLIDCRLDK